MSVLVTACLLAVAPAVGAAEPFQARVDELIADGFAVPLGRTRAELAASLGPPRSATVRRVQNRHEPGRTDEVHELEYDGLRIVLYRVSATGRELIMEVSLTSERYRLKWGLGVGSTRDAVRRVLGPGVRAERGEIDTDRYEDSERASRVDFSFRDARVRRIDWVFWLD